MAATLFLLTSAVAYAAIYHVRHWRGVGTERLHFWAAVWCANTVMFLTGRLLTVTSNRPGAWSGQEIELLSSFADQAAGALTNAHLYEAEAAARAEAEGALAQVRTLHDNYWVQIESYVTSHSAATFTHGICPECRAKALDSS